MVSRAAELTGRFLGVGTLLLAGAAQAQVARLQVDPSQVTINVGQRFEVLATALDQGNNVLLGLDFQWTSHQPATVGVEAEPDGIAMLVGLAPGDATVEVAVGSRSATISVQVQGMAVAGPIGEGVPTKLEIEPATVFLFPTEDLQLLPRFLKGDDSPAAPVSLTWNSFRPEVVTIDASGVLVAIQPGPGLVEATSEGGLGRRVQVQVGVASLAIGHAIVSLAPGESDTVGVAVPDQGGRLLGSKWVQWSASNRGVATVSSEGVITAISGGETQVIASAFGQEASVQVRVHAEVDAFDIGAIPGDTIMVPIGGTAPFRVVPVAADNTPIPEAPITWIVGDPTVVQYSVGDSLATGRSVGVTTLEARYKSEIVRAWVLNVVPARLAIDETRVALPFGSSHQLEAWFANEAGDPLAPATDVTWRSSNASVIAMTAPGEIRAVGFGGADVIASTPWGNADTAEVFVVGDLIFTSTRSGSADLFTTSLTDPSTAGQITGEASMEFEGVFSPDGSRIAFVSDRGGQFDLFVASVDGRDIQRVTATPEGERSPAWSPDGQRLVYESNVSGLSQVWIIDVDGGNARELTIGDRDNRHPAVSPDGQTIAFTSLRDGNADIYLMGIDGSDQRNFTSTRTEEYLPKWVDGQTLVFLRKERGGRSEMAEIVSLSLQREEQILANQRPILGFDIRFGGDLIAMVLSMTGPSGDREQRLFVTPPEGGDGPAAEIGRVDGTDQLAYPAFRP